MMDSSDPISTSDEIESSGQQEEEIGAKIEEPVSESTTAKKKGKQFPYLFVIMVDLIMPLALILSAISVMSIIGIVFVVLLYIHISIANLTTKNFIGMKICIIVELIITLVVLIFGFVALGKPMDGQIWKLLGLDFDNIISNSPVFTIVINIIGIICHICGLATISKTSPKAIEARNKMFTSLGFQYSTDFIWGVCNAFNASSNMSFVFFPILFYFAWSNIAQSICGKPVFPKNLISLIMIYSLFYAGWELYMVSYIGNEYPPTSNVRYNYIGPENSKAANVVLAVIFAYISIQNLTAPGLRKSKGMFVPGFMKTMSNFFLVCAFIATFIYGMFYPNYLSLTWLVIPFIASFGSLPALRKFHFPLLTIIFTISFLAMSITDFGMFDPPVNDGVEQMYDWVRLFGLYRNSNDFVFSVCGYFIIMLLGQIGRIEHSDIAPKKKKEKEAEKNHDEEEDELGLFAEEHIAEMKQKEKEMKKKKRIRKRRLKALGDVVYSIISYLAIAVIIVIGIISGFFKDRFVFQIVCVIFMIVVLLALYKKWVFECTKILSGLMIIFAAFYKTSYYQECLDDNSCIIFGDKWGTKEMKDIVKIGLFPPADMDLAEFIWPILIIFILSIFLTRSNDAIKSQLSPLVTSFIYFLVAFLHFLYVFLYDTNIFSLLFFLVGLFMLTSQYLKNQGWLAFSLCFSCVVVSVQLCIFLLSHFDAPRNLITSVIDLSIVNISKTFEPDFEIVLLAVILFFSTIAFNSAPPAKNKPLTKAIFYEIRLISDLFYFYLCWIFIFLFSIANDYPTLLKFLLMLFFAFGRWSSTIFDKIRLPFLIFSILYVCAQFLCQIFGWDRDQSKQYYNFLEYIGFLFAPGSATKYQRNVSLCWQFVQILINIVNVKSYRKRTQEPWFENLLPVRIYNAICAMLHHWLPIIIQISLCTSTLFNPSIFGWFSFIVMTIVNFKEEILQSGSGIITLIFNICFIAQYLLYLQLPEKCFNTWHFNVMEQNSITKLNSEDQEFVKNWLKWAGIYDVSTAALSTNCVSAFVFTFYLAWHNNFVDYDQRFNVLPEFLKTIINLITTYIFEIMVSLVMVVTYQIKTFDAFLFFVLVAALLLCALLFDYPKSKALNYMSIGTFCVIALRLLSRLPIFTEDDIGKWVKRAFDVPFQGEAKYESLWIIIYALERVAIHLMKSNLYAECKEAQTKHIAYRYIRSRQLDVIAQLDQDILKSKHEMEITQVQEMAGTSGDDLVANLKKQDSQFLGKAELKNTRTSLTLDASETKRSWYQSIAHHVLNPFIDRVIRLFAMSYSPNNEAGVNVLTLETLTIVMKKHLRTVEQKREYVPDAREKKFYNSLPPTFALHFHSIADVLDYTYYHSEDRYFFLVRYMFMFVRKLALPLLTLMILIFIYVKPYIFSMLVVMLFVVCILSIDLKHHPNLYRILFGIVLLIYILRDLSCIDILTQEIDKAANSIFNVQLKISLFQLFGIDPNESSTPELFLFLFTVYFIVDQTVNAEVYPPKYYLRKFSEGGLEPLPGFPEEYCYGVMNDPVAALGMSSSAKPLLENFKDSMTRIGLIEYSHSWFNLIIDIFSFIVLLCAWSTWSQDSDSAANLITGSVDFVFEISVLLIFILLIHIVFMLLSYFCSLSQNYMVLYCVNLIWFLYTYTMSFFYVRSRQRTIPSSLQFYFFVRFFAHMVISHQCFTAKKNVAFNYPNFLKDWRFIIYLNKFIRLCPFVFELQTILIWMTQETYVSLTDFLMIRDIKQQLEILIAQQNDPKWGSDTIPQKRVLKGGVLLFLIALLLFGPLFFMTTSAKPTVNNPVQAADLEFGFQSLPVIFMNSASISGIDRSIQSDVSSLNIKSLSPLILSSSDTMQMLTFSDESFINWSFTPNYYQSIKNQIADTNFNLVPYYRFTFYFTRATAGSGTPTIVHQVSMDPLSPSQREIVLRYLNDGNAIFNENISLPLTIDMPEIIIVPSENRLSENPDVKRYISLDFKEPAWEIVPQTQVTDKYFSALNGNDYKVLLWSQPVLSDNIVGQILDTGGGIVGIYILIIITFGLVLREHTLGSLDSLWLDRMDQPQKLYRMVIAVETFKSTDDASKELIMTNQLLDTLRSHETCLKITARDFVGD